MPGRDPLPNWDQYATRWTVLHGGVDPRRARTSVGTWLRSGYVIAKFCARVRIKPATITIVGLLACLLIPISVKHGTGGMLLAGALVLIAAIADTVDGALAVVTSHATKLGYVYDSVVDRIGEVCWLVALWRIGVPGYLALTAGALSWLHEYTRARANAAGMREIGASTLGERPTRVMLAFIGFALGGLVGMSNPDLPRSLGTFVVAIWCVLALIGFLQLFATIHRALVGRNWPMWQSATPPQPVAPPAQMDEQADEPVAEPMDEEYQYFSTLPATTEVYTSQFATEIPAAD
jgi:phosphatidylglycerophosphate synthase